MVHEVPTEVERQKIPLPIEQSRLRCVSLLNAGQDRSAVTLLESQQQLVTDADHKNLITSNLLATLAIQGDPASLRRIPTELSSLTSYLLLPPHKEAILNNAFNGLRDPEQDVSTQTLRFDKIPNSFRKRIGNIPVYENRLLRPNAREEGEWIELEGANPLDKEVGVDQLVKTLLWNTLSRTDGDIF